MAEIDRRTRGYLWLAAISLLLMPAFFLPPVPIDETRYLAVAWNMHLSGHWLVPSLDGMPYPDKPPLLFWLINLCWMLTGVHALAARLLEVVFALATLPLLSTLGRGLGATEVAVRRAQWLWLGSVALAGFAGGIMFDMLLTLCTLCAWLGTLALARNAMPKGVVILAAAVALGILAKGPVGLLVGGLPALLAPWWYPAVRSYGGRYALAVAVALSLGIALALAWALPAAQAGGSAYADAIFLRQTVGRLASSFAHARGWWWYLPVLPALLLPWSLALARGERAATSGFSLLDRFAVAAFVPAFLAFCMISGKQPHYLLPLLPALALVAGSRLADGRWRVVSWRVGAVLTLFPLGFAAAARLLHVSAWVAVGGAVVIAALALAFLWRGRRTAPAEAAALAMIAAVGLAKLAFVSMVGARYDVTQVSQIIARAQRTGVPLVLAGRQNGMYTFAGRLTQAIPSAIGQAQIAAWAVAHPEGWVISSHSRKDYSAEPLYSQPFGGRHDVTIWRAGDIADEATRAAATAPSIPEDDGEP